MVFLVLMVGSLPNPFVTLASLLNLPHPMVASLPNQPGFQNFNLLQAMEAAEEVVMAAEVVAEQAAEVAVAIDTKAVSAEETATFINSTQVQH